MPGVAVDGLGESTLASDQPGDHRDLYAARDKEALVSGAGVEEFQAKRPHRAGPVAAGSVEVLFRLRRIGSGHDLPRVAAHGSRQATLGQPTQSRRVRSRPLKPHKQAVRPAVSARVLCGSGLCEPEVTGSTPVRSTRSPEALKGAPSPFSTCVRTSCGA